MKISTRHFVGLLLLSSIASSALVSGCSQGRLPEARSGVSEEEARKELEQRLLRSDEVNSHLNAIRKALQPIEAAFRDLGRVVELKLNGRPSGILGNLLDRLDVILRDAAKGLVRNYPGGKWTIERSVPQELLTRHNGACAQGRIRVEGTNLSGAEVITISLSDCNKPDQFERIAKVVVHSNGNREVEISTAAFEGRRVETINIDPCHLRVEPKGYSELTCTPMVLESSDFMTEIEQLDVRGDSQSIRAEIRATISHRDFNAKVSISPDHIPAISVCTRGEPCFQ